MMRWHSSGQSCIKPSMAFPSWLLNFLDPRPSPFSAQVSRRLGPCKVSLEATMPSLFRLHPFVSHKGPIFWQYPIMRLLIALLWLAGACGIALAQDVPLPNPRPPIWAAPQTFHEAAGPDF